MILKNMLISFATGASFALGVLVIVTAYALFKDQEEVGPSTKVFAPDDLRIVEHKLVPDREKFTVQGTIENNGDGVWPFALVKMRVFSGGALMSGCSVDLSEIQPNSRKQFELICSTTQGRSLPDNMTYLVEIPWGWRLE